MALGNEISLDKVYIYGEYILRYIFMCVSVGTCMSQCAREEHTQINFQKLLLLSYCGFLGSNSGRQTWRINSFTHGATSLASGMSFPLYSLYWSFLTMLPLCQRDNLWRWCSIMAVNSNIPSPGKGLVRLCCVPVIEKPLWIHHTAACWRLCVEIKLGDLTTSRREGTVCSVWKNPVLPVISSQSQMLLD